jgi:WS/DGAT/MGAT family acyltransferase
MTTSMTALEASFLELEHPGIPMHVAGLSVLEGGEPVTLDALHHLVGSRIRRLPRFRDRAAFDLTHREWMHESRADLRPHFFEHRLPRRSTAHGLFGLAARIHESPIRRDGPLWEMHLIDGLSGGGQALVIKTHHAITDGLAAMEMGGVLFDPAPGAPRTVSIPAPRLGTGGGGRVMTTLQGLMGLALTAAGGPLAHAGPFNGPVGARRSFAGVPLPMTAIRELKQQCGVSVDDVLVAAVSVGLRRYLHQVGYPDIPHALRAMIPVSTRTPARGVTMGNHVSSIFLDLPLDSDDVCAVARRVSARKSTLRGGHASAGATMAIEAGGHLPAPLHALTLGFVATLPFAHVVLSDVPGPLEPRYLLGRRITACYPMMPLGPSLGLAIAAISMSGVMAVGVTADPGLVPRPERIAGAIASAVGL